ncbi:FAD-dependent oxidoreductase [candidate division BRC1 bacterium HGW-BRC1-1]|nr:MAG: FAD-dependent oxidoreductase [candidate division BRC1 bacterium HGW-BRC1-1]
MSVKFNVEVLIVGGGTGGCAAAMAAASMGKRVLMTEETDWVGGQLTSQAVPPDEHPWIEKFGCTARYRRFRDLVRRYYSDHYSLTAAARAEQYLNPGAGAVSALCHEPRVALAVIEAMLAPHISAGRLDVRLQWRPLSATSEGDRVTSITFRDLATGETHELTAPMIIDATELGDLLAMADVEYVSGAESRDDTGEANAVEGPAQPDNVQGITWCFAMSNDEGSNRVIDRPKNYEKWRDYVPQLTPEWGGPLVSWKRMSPVLNSVTVNMLAAKGEFSMWLYRQIVCAANHEPGTMPFDATIVNWPQNDYWENNIIDRPEDEVAVYLEESRELSMALFYWMQTEAPRHDGGTGYPGLFLRGDLLGTKDGMAKAVYVREARRIKAMFTVTENHVGKDALGGKPATQFEDSVGVGAYRIDLHPSTAGNNYIDLSAHPFQIPLGALVPVRVKNLLPACKNIGSTHLTNGCYRLHPVEWNIGEAAGLLAAFALDRGVEPQAVREQPALLADFQALVDAQGIERNWPELRAL